MPLVPWLAAAARVALGARRRRHHSIAPLLEDGTGHAKAVWQQQQWKQKRVTTERGACVARLQFDEIFILSQCPWFLIRKAI